ncbi:dentin sialophosphoprotein [Spatholobus suberectus]|nr:dentin sialophosphoprotein [Spatholobus suberectus]
MAGAIHATKQQKLPLEQNQQDPNKFYYHFAYKATLVLIFFVILPLFPSQAPEFINQSLLTRNWELLHLLFVGVAISYGLFSRRNDETEKEHNTKFDTAQSLVSRFLQVSSFFEDEAENPVESDETKVQTWSSQHRRSEPVVVVAPQLKKRYSFDDSQSAEKPLLLPVRSLKSRLSDGAEDVDVQSLNRSTTSSSRRFSSNSNRNAGVEADDADVQSLNRSTTSKRFSSNSNRNAEVEGPRAEDKKKENVVLPSPIPWRSRSGRMEPKQEEVDDASNMVLPSKEESRPVKSQSSRASSRTSSSSPSPNLTPLPSFSSESLAKNAEDLVRKKGFYKSCPPPPPPPPPMMFQKSMSWKQRYGGSFSEEPSFDKELKRSFTSERNMPVRKISDEEDQKTMQRTSFKSDKFMGQASVPLVSEPAEKESFLDKVLVESDDDDEDTETEDEDVGGGRIVRNDSGKGPPVVGGESSKTDGGSCGTIADEGPDVDKKADEFIAKFREQIRLQRIESIKRSTRNARNSSR